MATPAQAVFGLSACEKVKKQVLSWEKQVNTLINDFGRYNGGVVPRNQENRFISIHEDRNDLVIKLNKIEFNNPKCFTRTQNEEINKRKANWDLHDFLSYAPVAVLKNISKCKKDAFQYLNPTPECLDHYDYKIYEVYSYPSIYES